jgi:Spy/CpxP family protein refolding chaperone
MEPNSKYRWMIWAIAFLALMNIATILTVVFQRSKADTVITGDPIITDTEGSSAGYSGRFFRDQLNLTQKQMDQFFRFNAEFRQQAREINRNLNWHRNQMLKELTAAESDTGKLNLLSDSIGFLHSDLKKVTYNYYLNFKKICTPEQQENLELLFCGIFTNDLPMGQKGRGGQFGRRNGRNFNNQ